MVKRSCPRYGKDWYSADTTNRVWICSKCGAEIPKEAERPVKEKEEA